MTARDRILQAGERLVFQKSFHGVGLAEILEQAETTKGGFYHFFRSKDEFGVELVRSGLAREIARMTSLLNNPTVDAMGGLELYWNSELGRLMAGGCRHDSLVVKLGAEVANLSPEMRAVMTEGLIRWRNILLGVIERGQSEGSITPSLKPGSTAILIQDLWNGALLRCGIEQSAAPLQEAIETCRQLLLPKDRPSRKAGAR